MAATGGAHSHWTSPFAFLMASVGFAVGLGNIWRFPYVAGENGGSAFVLIYLVCAFVIGVPILMAELMIGRRGNAAPPIAMARVADGERPQPPVAVGRRHGSARRLHHRDRLFRGGRLGALVPVQGAHDGLCRRGCGVAEAQFAAVLGDNFGMLFWTWSAWRSPGRSSTPVSRTASSGRSR
jgi:NSS family neurotransmitter:Na+ symporter